MSKWITLGIVAWVSSWCSAAQVWQSTFDAGPDGVVDVLDQDSGKATIGTASGGALQITNWDNSTNAYSPDKAGRPLGSTLNGSNSFSGLYQYRWSTLNTVEAQAAEVAGFIGNAGPQTRQVTGALIRHWAAGSDYYVALDVAVGSVGASDFGYRAGNAIYLGTNPTANNYQFAVGYDGATHVLSLQLFNAVGTLLGQNVADLDTDVPGLQLYGGVAAELNNLALTHLGWTDYTYNGGNKPTVWQIDTLTYFNTADGAALAVVPEPGTLGMLGLLGLGLVRRRSSR